MTSLVSISVTSLKGSNEINSDAREIKTIIRGDWSYFINHMIHLIALILYFAPCTAAYITRTSPAGRLTSARNVRTHLESDGFRTGIKLMTLPYVAS